VNEITLTTPYRGSSGDATPVTFSAGTIYVRLIADARQIAKLEGITAGATVSNANRAIKTSAPTQRQQQ
jgi:hypothetical protein